jgi:hypothetical protein
MAGDLLVSFSHTGRGIQQGGRIPGQLPVYDSIKIRHPAVFEEYERYESLEKLIAERYGAGEEESEARPDKILSKYELMKALVGHKSSIEAKLTKYPFDKNVFIMMKYRDSNKDLSDYIKEALESHGLNGVRADDPRWNITNDIYNPIAVLYCCKYGLALFDEAEKGQTFSLNVGYELGIMHCQQKNCLILKHASLPTAPFDLLKDLHKPYSKDLQVRCLITDWVTEISEE